MKDIRLDSPLQGRLIPLSEVSDPAFASGAMGRGAAVADPEGRVVSPVDGEVTVLFETKHAIGIHGTDGVDILIHVGVDTVKLEGKGFEMHVAMGDRVKAGTPLVTFDRTVIHEAGYQDTVIMAVTNSGEYPLMKKTTGMDAKAGETPVLTF